MKHKMKKREKKILLQEENSLEWTQHNSYSYLEKREQTFLGNYPRERKPIFSSSSPSYFLCCCCCLLDHLREREKENCSYIAQLFGEEEEVASSSSSCSYSTSWAEEKIDWSSVSCSFLPSSAQLAKLDVLILTSAWIATRQAVAAAAASTVSVCLSSSNKKPLQMRKGKEEEEEESIFP